jgi:choline dehydrogenase-like flavoprotein
MEVPINPDDMTQFDFIVCGSGSSAAFLARCLAGTGDIRVLRLDLDLDLSEIPWFPASLGKAHRCLRVNIHASDAAADHDVEPQLMAVATVGIQGRRVGNGGY